MRPDKKNFEERQLPGYNMNISRAGHNEGIIQVPFKQVEKSLKTGHLVKTQGRPNFGSEANKVVE